MKIWVIFISLILFLSSCSSFLLSIYGVKNPKIVDEEKILAFSKKLNIDANNSYILKSDYLAKEIAAQNPDRCEVESVTKLTQPLQIRIYGQNDSLIVFQNNCDCGGFPNLQWNRFGIFDTIPPNRFSTLPDTSLLFTRDISNFLPLNDRSIIKHSLFLNVDYKIVIIWAIFMKRQSKRLIKKVNEFVQTYPEKSISIIYVNSDNQFAE